jgi:hypothetical protein
MTAINGKLPRSLALSRFHQSGTNNFTSQFTWATSEHGDIISIRELGRRTKDTARIYDLLWWLKRSKADKARMEKLRARKTAKAARLAARKQRAATRKLFNE